MLELDEIAMDNVQLIIKKTIYYICDSTVSSIKYKVCEGIEDQVVIW